MNEDQRKGAKKRAAALVYDGSGAPRVVAKGHGEIAQRIEHLALQHDIPLMQDPVLTTLLTQVPLGDEIPESLYIAVAEVLAHVYRVGQAIDSLH